MTETELRDFLSQRDSLFDGKHTIKEVLAMDEPAEGDVRARARLEFFLRRWEARVPDAGRGPQPLSRHPNAQGIGATIAERRLEGPWPTAAPRSRAAVAIC